MTQGTNTINHILSRLSIILVICAGSFGCQPVSADASALSKPEATFQQATTLAFQELSNQAEFTSNIKDVNLLVKMVTSAEKKHRHEQALGLIANNIKLVEAHPTNKALLDLALISLNDNALGITEKICSFAISSGSASLGAECTYEMATYLAAQNNWDQVLLLLKSIEINNDLSAPHADNSFILWGAALQHIKKHRQALDYYQRIKPESSAYPLAQLNMALVYIRQDWWTDAQIAMQAATKANDGKDVEFDNRVYTTLGFSQLQQGFYRNARESFRKVKINSEYADQALLGLGNAALNQEDFLGAFNAFEQLKKSTQKTTAQDQSYLLSAFSLAKLKQEKSAADAYAEAITHYEQQIGDLSAINTQLDESNLDTNKITSNLIAKNIKVTPENAALKNQMHLLQSLLSYQLSETTTAAIARSYTQLMEAYKSDTREKVNDRLAILNTYLNQSRFGLTKLYDTP